MLYCEQLQQGKVCRIWSHDGRGSKQRQALLGLSLTRHDGRRCGLASPPVFTVWLHPHWSHPHPPPHTAIVHTRTHAHICTCHTADFRARRC